MTYTQEQQNIIHSDDQHIVVVANAGTGKTTTIIEKIKYLLDNKHTFANRIMLTSFSRVAASELYGKASESFGREYADQMSIGTIHSICYKIVMGNLNLLGFSTLVIRGDSYLTAIALNRHPGVFESKKDATQSTATYRRYLIDGVYPKRLGDNKFNALVEAQEIMESNNGVLFDDLLLKSILILEKNEDIRKNWQSKFDWIMCDECLPYYTPIHLPDGSFKYIGDIVENKESCDVVSYNEKTHQQEVCRITGWSKTPNIKQLVKISSSIRANKIKPNPITNFVVCTIDHKIFTYNRGWVEAGSIVKGDIIQIETDAHKDSRYKITDKGKKTLSNLMNTNEKAILNNQKACEAKKKSGKKDIFFKRGGNGQGLTFYQEFLLNYIINNVGGCWQPEGIIRIPADVRKKYNTPNHYKVDIFNESVKICIELDGPSHDSIIGKERDIKKTNVLQELGFVVLRYKNADVLKNVNNIITTIKSFNISENCILQSEVISVDFSSNKENYVYDITVEKCHNFYANGILVHNCQDTNELQWKIVELLSSTKTKTVMIGDAKQNIYQFRGCSYEYLEDYRNKVNAKIFPLTETFRFGQPFADVSNRVVANLIVPDAYKKHTVTKIDRSTKPEFIQLSEDDQLSNCVEKVRAFIDSGYSYKDMNVVYRYNKEAIPFMKQFMKEKIPFVIKSGDIFERIELKFVMQSVGLLHNFNLNDCISLFSMYSDFVGDKTLTTIYNSVESSSTVIEFLEKAMKTKISGVGAYKKRSLKSMLDRFNDLNAYIKMETNIPRIASIMNIEETKFMLKEEENKNQGNPSEDRMEFLSFFDECFRDSKKENLIDWYNDLVTNGHKVTEKQKDAVNLKTIHGCKGQTLPIVFFISNKIGDSRFIKEEKDLEAEKFCLYVALTRAEKQLIIYNNDPVRFKFPFIFPEEWQEQIKTLAQNEESSSSESTTSDIQESLSKSPSSSDRVIKECFQVAHATPKAILFSFGKHSFWVPKSSVSFKNNRYFLNKWIVSKNNIERYMEDYR